MLIKVEILCKFAQIYSKLCFECYHIMIILIEFMFNLLS